jgi:hypothetical protein
VRVFVLKGLKLDAGVRKTPPNVCGRLILARLSGFEFGCSFSSCVLVLWRVVFLLMYFEVECE